MGAPITERGKRANEVYNKDMHYVDQAGNCTQAGKTNFLSNIMLVALLVIGCVAAAGVIPSSITGWTAVGIGSGLLVIPFLGKKLKDRKSDLICSSFFALAIISLGAVGGVGLLTVQQISFSLIGIVAAQALFYCCCCRVPSYSRLRAGRLMSPQQMT